MQKKKGLAWPGAWVLGMVVMFFALSLGNTGSVSGVRAEEMQWTTEEYVRTVGNGRVMVEPDEAVLDIGVRTRGKEVQKAVEENTRQMDEVIRVIREKGVADDEIQTQGYYVNEEYDIDPKGNSQVTGYVVVNDIRVTVKKLENVGSLIDAATEAGANQIGGIRFQLSDAAQADAEAQALKKAVENARNKALVLSESEGRSLGKVLIMDEMSAAAPPVIFREAANDTTRNEESTAQMSTPIQSGQMEVQVQISVSYQLQ